MKRTEPGRWLGIDGFRVAGKTGTAQKIDAHGKYSHEDYIASFVGIVPADAPRFVIAVSVDQPTENGYYGGQVAAPVFQEIATHALASWGIETATPPQQKKAPPKSFERGVFPPPVALRQAQNQVEDGSRKPNFLGLSLREALRLAREQGWQVTLTGSGYVAQQAAAHDPDSGQQFYALTLAPTGDSPPAQRARPATLGSELESQEAL